MLIKPVLLHFKFNGFADLPSRVDSYVFSDVHTDDNGDTWKLKLYPGGNSAAEEQGHIAVYLAPESRIKESFGAAFSFSIKDANGATILEEDLNHTFDPGTGGGILDGVKRDRILDPNNSILKDGALCIDVRIQVKDKKDGHYVPESKLSKKMMKLLESGERADASFKVGDCTFPVHSDILHNNAPILANYLHQEQSSGVIVEGISSDAFKLVLAFIYAEQYPSDIEMLHHGEALIDAANKYELVDLKMTVENVLVRERILTTKNVCDYILFADAQSCPLLKEYATTFFLLNVVDVLKSEHSKRLKESGKLLAEMLMQVANSNDGTLTLKDTLSVNELRLELGKRKLDVDGSKEALVSRLEEAKRQRTE